MTKIFVGLLFLTAVLSFHIPEVTREDFETFKQQFRVQYATPEEEAQRWGYFLKNVAEAYARNSTEPYAIFGINKFSDRSPEELRRLANLFNQPNDRKINDISNAKKLPLVPQQLADKLKLNETNDGAFDWRNMGAVTSVKDQGGCGSCWAFGTVGSFEATWSFQNTLTDFSEEELLNCCGRDGLDGGAYCGDWLARNGLNTLSGYPYKAGYDPSHCYGSCDNAKANVVAGRIGGISCIENDPSGANEAYVNLYMQMEGPMITSLASSILGGYVSGIISSTCGYRNIDHTVLIVGQGTQNGVPYWILKNSWGTSFGESGYFRMRYGVCCGGFCGGGNCVTHN
eukprot:TRINITY_DN595_c0_g1_i5.p1 TRINITY_DN595_c0_g1~~TRINITY_DN595_c0_g1_i5.p1  ORF type:complete len:350 (-),score=92.10 TRINITY_DN595_c0_g1_i5:169-1194(-)